MKLYTVIEEGICDYSDTILNVRGVFLTKKRAIKHLKKVVEKDRQTNPDWYNDECFIQNWAEDSTYFEIYKDGYYGDDHFSVSVLEYREPF